MKFKSKKEAIASITTRSRVVNGKEYTLFEVYLGTNCITKRAERLAASTKGRLIEMIGEFYEARESSGELSSVLTADQIVDARAALKALSDANMNISLLECAKREIGRFSASCAFDVTVGEAYDNFVDSKNLNSELEKKKTESTTGNWVLKVGRDTRLIDVTPRSVLEYLKTNYDGMKPRTYNAHLTYLKTFFNWCAAKSQGYIPESPAADIAQKPIEWEEPEFMSTDDCKKLFRALWERREYKPECLALAVNGLCMGIRREESLRMATDRTAISVNLDDETVRVAKPKGYTKGIMPRAFKMPPMAVAWARSFDYSKAVSMITEKTSAEVSSIASSVGVSLPRNGFRHTFITKHVAAYGEPDKTQAMVGTSAQMRANNYCGLDSKKEGLAFFDISPEEVAK